MGIVTLEYEETYAVPPTRMFKALASDQLYSKLFRDVVKKIEILEGNGGPGSIKKISLVEGGQDKYMKQKIEEVDEVNLKLKYSVIEGNDLASMKLEKVSYDHKWEASDNGGSICKTIRKLHANGEVQVTEEQAKAAKEKGVGIVKAIEAYLLANPDAYN